MPPVVILVRPQLAENIGMCARAMMNFGLREMRLVARATAGRGRARGRPPPGLRPCSRRHIVRDDAGGDRRPQSGLRHDGPRARPDEADPGGRCGGAGDPRPGRGGARTAGALRAGADGPVERRRRPCRQGRVLPGQPGFTSINLAQAVLLVGYEWWKLASGGQAPIAPTRSSPPARREHVLSFIDYLEAELDRAAFFNPLEKRPIMTRNLRNIWHRLEMSEQDVQTLRGVVAALVAGRRGRAARKADEDDR